MCVCGVPVVTGNFCKSSPGKVRNFSSWAVAIELTEKALLIYPFFISIVACLKSLTGFYEFQ